MSQLSLFSSGQELAKLMLSSDLLHHCWNTTSELLSSTYLNNNSTNLGPVLFNVYKYHSNGAIVSFLCSPSYSVDQEMISSDELKGSQVAFFDFISTKVNPHFSVHKTALVLFASLLDKLTALKEELGSSSPLIITGHWLGGSVASLFTLWLLDNISLKDKKNKRPTCITFGSPLLGCNAFQQAISERPTWSSSFLHVVSNQDPIPRFLISQTNDISTSNVPIYKPFGTFLVCSESDCSCFEEPESVLDLMMVMNSNSQHRDNGFPSINYGHILECLNKRVFCKGTSQLMSDFRVNELQAGIVLELEAIGIDRQWQHTNLLIKNMEERVEASFLKKKKAFDLGKKLNKLKEDMAYFEWYKKVTSNERGYYDNFKYRGSGNRDDIKRREEIVKRQRILTKYWKRMVAEVEKMPQREGSAFRLRWLYAGTNYRRMVEPLDIAEYYMKGCRDYVNVGRSDHYKLLEIWMNEDKMGGNGNVRRKATCTTEDSCFWAYVEELVISSNRLREGFLEEKENLGKFGEIVMSLIRSFSVSPEVFQEETSFMKWWQEYEDVILSSFSNFPLASFMEAGEYRGYA